ncbi:glucose-1-phosphate cytidylyltransferase, partial [Ralstonia sp. TCR112]
TGGRLKRVAAYLDPNEPFCFTYGDGVSDIDITSKIAFHRAHGKMATVTAVQPPGRYGMLQRDGARVTGFTEKPPGDGGSWINGGFFVLNPAVIEYIATEDTPWEGAPMARLAEMGELNTFEHHGFWQPMDTLRDKNSLEALWQAGSAPWKKW